jgi:hypothetical protein
MFSYVFVVSQRDLATKRELEKLFSLDFPSLMLMLNAVAVSSIQEQSAPAGTHSARVRTGQHAFSTGRY